MSESENRRTGKIKFVNFQAKFGFIRDIETNEEFYFKTSDLKTKTKDHENLIYTFTLKEAKRGDQAVDIIADSE